MSIRKIIFSVAAAAAAFTSAIPAAAQEVESAQVYVGDLDLASAKGMQRFNHRVAKAAEQICGRPSAAELEFSAARRACRSEIMASVAPRREAMVAAGTRYAMVSARAVRTN